MSYIDSSTNVHCADLHLGLHYSVPIYWVLDGLEHDTTGAPVKKHDLLIGGGSGEHEMLQIRNADLLPLWLMSLDTEETVCEETYRRHLMARAEDHNERGLFDNYSHIPQIFYCIAEWPLKTLAKIEKCFVDSAPPLGHYKLNPAYKSKSAEEAFLISIAKFVLYHMPPEFFSDTLLTDINRFKPEFIPYDFTGSVLITRPFDGFCSGKVIKDGRAVWGYGLDDYLKDVRG